MLSDKPIRSIILLIVTNLAIIVVATVLSSLLPSISQIVDHIIEIIIKFIFWCLLVFLIVPFGFRLPKKNDSFRDYIEGIHLTTYKPVPRILLYTISCYGIFVLFQLIGSLIYGSYVFDPSRIIPPQSFSLLDFNAGLFEEIMFRGIILTLLMIHYSEKTSLWISAIFFGIVHYANLINDFSFEFFMYTTAQVAWAFGMGLLWGYLVIKTNSLLPGIILHYLSNALDSLWLYTPMSSIEIFLLYKLIFGKFIPIIISIIWIAIVSKKATKKDHNKLEV